MKLDAALQNKIRKNDAIARYLDFEATIVFIMFRKVNTSKIIIK